MADLSAESPPNGACACRPTLPTHPADVVVAQLYLKMGQTLSEPITSKESASLQNAKVKVGSSSMQGWRISMEDSHTHILKLPEDPDSMFFGGQ